MFTPPGATESTVPSRSRSGIASKVTRTFWLGATRAASDSSNGTTTWKVFTLFNTMNAEPPGRVADSAVDAEDWSLVAAAPTPGIPASVPGANAVVPPPGPNHSPTAPLIAETVPPTGAYSTVLSTSRCALATSARPLATNAA